MSIAFEKKEGAVEFTERQVRNKGTHDATVFTQQHDDFVDQGWDEIITTVRSLAALEEDWDGNHSVPPEQQVIDVAEKLAQQLKSTSHPAPTRVVPGVNGSISFEFGGEPFLEIEVVDFSTAEVYEDGKLIQVITTEEQ